MGPHPFCYQKCLQVFAATETFCLHTQLHSFSSIMGPHSIINSHRPYLLVTQSLCGRWVPHFPSFTCPMQDHTQFSWFLQDYDFDLIPREGREPTIIPWASSAKVPPQLAAWSGSVPLSSTTEVPVWGPLLSTELRKVSLGVGSQKSLLQKAPNPGRRLLQPLPGLPTRPAMILSRDLSEQGPASSEILVILKEPLKGLRAHQKHRVIL